ncbi:hypothetical protein ACFX14_001288 [Malus domestica]
MSRLLQRLLMDLARSLAGIYSKRNVMIFELGWGTLAVSLLTIAYSVCEVKVTAGHILISEVKALIRK